MTVSEEFAYLSFDSATLSTEFEAFYKEDEKVYN
jgi:hypothetical protein